MFAVKGSGTYNLVNNAYAGMGTMTTWPLVGTSSAPPEFSYDESSLTSLGQGLVANVPGRFRISSHVIFGGNATGNRNLRILKNGDVLKQVGGPSATAGAYYLESTATSRLDIGDRLGVLVYQNSGAALELVTNSQNSRQIVMEYLGT